MKKSFSKNNIRKENKHAKILNKILVKKIQLYIKKINHFEKWASFEPYKDHSILVKLTVMKSIIWKKRYKTEDKEVASSYQKLENIFFNVFLAQWLLNYIDFAH